MESNKWFYEENLIMPLDVKTKEEAIEKLGSLLLSNGYVKDTFIPAVLAREKEFATGLPTNVIGVAIPHTDSIHVQKQAVAVGLLAEPVKFCIMGDPFDTEVDVKLILMLAVPEKEKVMVMLKQVMEMIQDQSFLSTLNNALDRQKVVDMLDVQLNKGVVSGTVESGPAVAADGGYEIVVVVTDPVGLHARPASIFVKTAAKFKSNITVFHNEKKANAKSILSVLTLGVNKDASIKIHADGEDAQEALKELKQLVQSDFGDAS